MMRAMVSELEPAANGTISFSGRSGHSANAGAARAAVATVTDIRSTRTRRIAPSPILQNPLRLAQAVEQRGAQQELARQRRVFGLAAQLVVIAPAHRGIALFKEPLVADGLRLGVLDRHVAALPLVPVEFFLIGRTMQDAGELVGEVQGGGHGAVQPHAADRA